MFPTVGASLTLCLTEGALLGLRSASVVSSFLPVLRLGLVNPEGYIAFSLFPHLSAIAHLVMGLSMLPAYVAWARPRFIFGGVTEEQRPRERITVD